MKKLLLAVVCLIGTVILCSCGGDGGLFAKPTPTPIPEIDPSQVITVDDVAMATGYQPMLEGGAVTRNGNTATALYVSSPLGQDPVEITITQYNETVSVDDVWNVYANAKALRTSAEEVTELGENAFIAFPSINIYDRGCYIKITAGSGEDDNQRNLLTSVARTALAKFEQIVPPPVTAEDAVEQK